MTDSDITQIRIGNHKVGLIGLKKTIETMANSTGDQPDEWIAKEITKKLKKKNYIPDRVKDQYEKAFIRELRRYRGRPVEETDPRIPEIKVLGGGCVICTGLENLIMEVLTDIGMAADLEHIKEESQIADYKVKGTPAIVINNKVVCVGKLPSKSEIKSWLEAATGSRPTGGTMEKQLLIKNIAFSKPHQLTALVDYEEGRVVSRTFAQNPFVSLTLFAFDKGEEISAHTAPGDAMVQVLDGEATITIDGEEMAAAQGEVVVMPADIPHAVKAVQQFKMLLTVVKKPKTIGS